MTCNHVLGLIDAGPFAGYPPAHLQAAREHARHCPTCGPALAVADGLELELRTLGHPLPPADLSGRVLARIDTLEAAHAAAAEADIDEERARGRRWAIDWPMWTVAAGAMLTVLAIAVLPRTAKWTPLLVTLWNGHSAGVPPPTTSTALGAILLVGALVLYIAGLFVPAQEERR